MHNNLEERLRAVVAKDGRYPIDAYRFMYEGLDYTVKQIGCKRHITGRELCLGLRNLAIDQFGGLSLMVFKAWGILRTSDFGDIVFNLVDAELMSRSEGDSRSDFDNVYDFPQTFRIDAQPQPIGQP